MYCSTCGGAVAPGLDYCNHCGTRLSGLRTENENRPAELFPDSLIWAIVSVFIVGLGGTIGLMAVMKDAHIFEPGVILGLSLLSFVAMLAVESVLVYLLLSRRHSARDTERKSQIKSSSTRELGVARERALAEPPLSVTEHTTRTLEPVYRNREQQ
jgi:hypothetical protein